MELLVAKFGKETMPPEGDKRGDIGSVKPSGWVQEKYSCVPNGWLWNRSHLIAWSLSDEDANKLNLITGTQHMNQNVMTDFEAIVRDYIKETGNHVMMRVTPIYEGNNLVATGVQIEAWSVEDNGEDVCFNVFLYNIQPGVVIDYATGQSRLATAGDSTYVASASSAMLCSDSPEYIFVVSNYNHLSLQQLITTPKICRA